MNGFCFFLSENGNIIDFPKLPKITGTACQDLTESGSETKVRIWDRKTDGFGWQLMTWHFQILVVALSCFFTLKGRYHNGATQMMLLWNDQGWIWRARWSAWVDYWRFCAILYFGGYRDAFHTKKNRQKISRFCTTVTVGKAILHIRMFLDWKVHIFGQYFQFRNDPLLNCIT